MKKKNRQKVSGRSGGSGNEAGYADQRIRDPLFLKDCSSPRNFDREPIDRRRKIKPPSDSERFDRSSFLQSWLLDSPIFSSSGKIDANRPIPPPSSPHSPSRKKRWEFASRIYPSLPSPPLYLSPPISLHSINLVSLKNMYNIRIDNLHAMLVARPPRSLLAILVATRGTRPSPPLLQRVAKVVSSSESIKHPAHKFSRRQIFFTLFLLFVAAFGRLFEVVVPLATSSIPLFFKHHPS